MFAKYRMGRMALSCALALAFLTISPVTTWSQGTGTLTVGLAGEIDSLDRILAAGGVVGKDIFGALYDRLTVVNPADGNVGPGLATSWRLVDPKTYVFVLRRGVKFHNGEEFDAQSAKFTLDLLLGSQSFMRSRVPYVESVEVVDKYTLRIRNSQADILLPTALGDVPIYPAQYYTRVGGQGFAIRPVGTGPFRFVHWDKGVRVVLERFDGYWGRKPTIQRLVFRPIAESNTRLAALEAGEIDIAVKVPPDDAARLERRGLRIVWTLIGQAMILHFNLTLDTPLKDKRVRQAINYAIDKEGLIKNVLLGYSRVLDGQLVGPDAFGYSRSIQAYPFDLQRAKQLLTAAGHPNGFTIKMETSEGNYTKHREISEAIAGGLSSAGIRVQMDVLEWATFVRKLIRTGDVAPLSYVGWSYLPAMDADYNLRHYATSSPFKFYSNRNFDSKYDQQRGETDRTKRRVLIAEASAILREEAPVAFLWQAQQIYALGPRVQSFTATADEEIHFDLVKLK